MAAGQGFKTFTTGEVLTAGDVNGYLMQGINVFTNATARDAAITAPAEGQFAFTKDNNSLWYYDGAAWVASGATGDIEGVTAGVGISGGGTSGTVTITNSMATAIDAKGDLVVGTGADAFSRIAVGANDSVLTADSTTATGVKWSTPSGALANYTLITNAGMGSGTTSVTFTGLSGYNTLMFLVKNLNSTNNNATVSFRFNSDSTAANYLANAFRLLSPSSWSASNLTGFENGGDDKVQFMVMGANSSYNGNGFIKLEGANSTGGKVFTYAAAAQGNATGSRGFVGGGAYLGTSVISSVTFLNPGNFDGGEIFIYGSVN
jgi:hypothetical protein